MLNINNAIVIDDIYDASPLQAGHPVYRLDGFGNDQGVIDSIVIKLESGQAAAVQFAASNMTAVNPNARTVLMNPQEVAAVRAFVSFGGLGDARAIPAAPALRADLAKQGTWVKMEYKQLRNLESAVKHRLEGDKADVRVIALTLRNPGGLEMLGSIIAVDLFNGYGDRFNYDMNDPNSKQGKQVDNVGRCNCLLNVGNVFVEILSTGRTRAVGLDTFDPFNDVKDPNVQVDPSWSGHLLNANHGVKTHFAGKVIEDLEMLLGARNRKNPFGTKARLGKRRKERLLEGMDAGAARLQQLVRNYLNSTPAPNQLPGVASRAGALGW